MVVVDGDVAGLAVEDPARLAHERVPDARAAAALGDGALDLVGGGGDAPREVRGKVEAAHGRVVGRGIRHVMVLRRVVGVVAWLPVGGLGLVARGGRGGALLVDEPAALDAPDLLAVGVGHGRGQKSRWV